jgi:hypothetical protein
MSITQDIEHEPLDPDPHSAQSSEGTIAWADKHGLFHSSQTEKHSAPPLLMSPTHTDLDSLPASLLLSPTLRLTVSEHPEKRPAASEHEHEHELSSSDIELSRQISDPITQSEFRKVQTTERSALSKLFDEVKLPTPIGVLAVPFVREEFFCLVCLENVDAKLAFGFSGNESCTHQFCTPCLR